MKLEESFMLRALGGVESGSKSTCNMLQCILVLKFQSVLKAYY